MLSISNGHPRLSDMLDREAFAPFLRKLREVPFVRSARVLKSDPPLLVIATASHDFHPTIEHKLRPELIRSHVSYALLDKVLSSSSAFGDQRSILLVPYVAPPLAHYLASKRSNFLDLAG